jgi:hypothetical protein
MCAAIMSTSSAKVAGVRARSNRAIGIAPASLVAVSKA